MEILSGISLNSNLQWSPSERLCFSFTFTRSALNEAVRLGPIYNVRVA